MRDQVGNHHQSPHLISGHLVFCWFFRAQNFQRLVWKPPLLKKTLTWRCHSDEFIFPLHNVYCNVISFVPRSQAFHSLYFPHVSTHVPKSFRLPSKPTYIHQHRPTKPATPKPSPAEGISITSTGSGNKQFEIGLNSFVQVLILDFTFLSKPVMAVPFLKPRIHILMMVWFSPFSPLNMSSYFSFKSLSFSFFLSQPFQFNCLSGEKPFTLIHVLVKAAHFSCPFKRHLFQLISLKNKLISLLLFQEAFILIHYPFPSLAFSFISYLRLSCQFISLSKAFLFTNNRGFCL